MTVALDRRRFLSGALAAGGLVAVTRLHGESWHDVAMAQTAPAGVSFDPAPFTLGVASGDPLADSVILWTRLAPEPLTGGGPLPDEVEVDWVIAADPRLRRVVAQGTAPAIAAMGHSVHVDVSGLEPGTTYWYRFAALGRTSRIGRTRTAPAPGAASFRFAYVSCQNFEQGFFAPFAALVAEDIDLVVHLGDYIYEGGGDGEGRSHTGDETNELPEYRNRYALYRGDSALRAVHAAFPFIVTWDDHEVDNNYAGLIPEDDDEAEGNDTPERFAQRRANAYAAYYEHMPIRLTEAGPPSGPDFRIYRRYTFGDLLEMSVLDTRQYRDDQPCDDAFFVASCDEQTEEGRTILGAEQREWLKSGLSASTTAWRCLAQQLMIGQLKTANIPVDELEPFIEGLTPASDGVYFNADQWDGYQAERADLFAHLANEGIPDTFVITGDIHSHWVHDCKPDFDDPESPVVATEYVGTSISTSGFNGTSAAFRQDFFPNNPTLRFFEGDAHGYGILEVTQEAVTNTFRVVGTSDTLGRPGTGRTAEQAPRSTLAVFRQMRGNPLVEQVEGGFRNPR